MYGVIYCISNIKNNKKYIGLTTRTIEQRFKEHTEASSAIGKAIRKHGIDNFRIEKIDDSDTKEELCKKEIYWIEKYNSFKKGYNQTIGGEGVDNIYRIPIVLNFNQKEFINFVQQENRKEIDINNKIYIIQSVLLNITDTYLNVDKPIDKRYAAKFINNLKPIYKKAIENFNVINFEELKSYL